jgi:hypothetical protein
MIMKRGMIGKSIFVLVISVFLLSLVTAALPEKGGCIVNTRAECTGNNHIVMGLSSLTNAHGQISPFTYDDVLCCAFGEGNTTCNSANAILRLSATTNAHAEISDRSGYTSLVCYEDLNCISTMVMSTCPEEFPIQTVSLTSYTNAHIGAFSDYPQKICCSSKKALAEKCEIKSASWVIPVGDVVDGQPVEMRVEGSGTECNNLLVQFDVQGGTYSSINQPMSVPFNGNVATGVWNAQHQSGFLGIGDVSYKFNASVFMNPATSKLSDSLTVRKELPIGTINTCADYTVAGQCNGDPEHVADVSSPNPETIDCSLESVVCSCIWNVTECQFAYFKIDDELKCDEGETKCYSEEEEAYYCYPGNVCPPDDIPTCNQDGICDFEEGCTCSDCEGKQDSCTSGLTCSNGKCGGDIPSSLSHTVCSSGLCTEVPGDGVNQCLPVSATCSIPSVNHAVCVGQACFLASGSGSSECSNSVGCEDQPDGYTTCVGGTCSEVSGVGVSQCAPVAGSCSTPTTSHTVCIGQSCVTISGSGSSECSNNEECGSPTPITTCTEDEDCDFGYICISGTCHFPIHTCENVTCPVGQYCRDGTCGVNGTTECTTEANCPSGYKCIAGFCFNPIDTCTGVICPSPSVCIEGTCVNDNGSIIDDGCGDGYTLCNAVGLFYCYPGSKCPTGETPGNDNGDCEFGYDGCSSSDCEDSDIDTCLQGLYCIDDKCGSVVSPVSLNLTNCKISQTITKDCNTEPTGYKTITWKGVWTGTSTTGASYLRCITGGTDNVPCPAEIQLPFFDYMELIASFVIIAAIYVSLVVKGKLKKKK